MNGGTNRGGAYGFSVTFLPRLLDVKSLQPRVTLMHFLATKVGDDVAGLEAEFADVGKCAKISFDSVKGNLQEVVGAMAKLEAEMGAAQQLITQGYRLFPAYRQFEADLTPLIRETKELLAKVDKDYVEVAHTFGEDPVKVRMPQFLGAVAGFTAALSKAEEDNKARAAIAEAQMRRAAAGPRKGAPVARKRRNSSEYFAGPLKLGEGGFAQVQLRKVPPKDASKPTGPVFPVQLKKVPPK